MSIELVMPSNHLIICHLQLLPPSVFPSIRDFSNESALHIRWLKYWSFSFSISPFNEYSGLIAFRMDWLDLLAVQTWDSQESSPIPQFKKIRVFSNESTLRMRWPKYWSFSFSIIPSKEIPGLISFRMDWLDYLDSFLNIEPVLHPQINLSWTYLFNSSMYCWILYANLSYGEGNGNSFQYSYVGNPMDRGAWRATVHGVTRVGHDLVTKPAPICL